MTEQPNREQILAVAPLVGVLLLMCLVFVATGILFAAWPAVLEGAGFGADPSALRRLAGLLFFGGVGVACLLTARALLTPGPSQRQRVNSIGTTIAVAAIGFIWRYPEYQSIGWVALIAAVSSLLLFLRVSQSASRDN